ncbi:homoserine kinase [Synchytrium microbalum]|uniref:Homoserine kinase n=1 Tax=Synchytrium microbalum TaxID=1806994 RepID=A0A507BS69_9FUNG|nr:homoserine kinase [Synchytrium microbalum]TPX30522.1 homoserine kinase [Synchytrium microbalum]
MPKSPSSMSSPTSKQHPYNGENGQATSASSNTQSIMSSNTRSSPRKRTFTIKVPASAANIGPGFDTLGLALSMHLTVSVTIQGDTFSGSNASGENGTSASKSGKASTPTSPTTPTSNTNSSSITNNNSGIVITYEGSRADGVSLLPSENMVTKTAMYVALAHNTPLPTNMIIHINNPIPLGRGMGSSGAAVVAGVILANEACKLNLSRDRLMDFALVVEGHPDNVAASMFGGFTAGYMRASIDETAKAVDECMSSSEDLAASNGTNSNSNGTTSIKKLEFPLPQPNLGVYMPLKWAKQAKAVVVIPSFELATKLARSVLPPNYSRADVVFNLQRLAVLTVALGNTPIQPTIIYEAMKDKIHQPYRSHLVPGLTEILELNPESCPGLIGICMSGAGPCVLAITIKNHEEVGRVIKGIWANTVGPDGKGIDSQVEVLDVETEGAVVLKS